MPRGGGMVGFSRKEIRAKIEEEVYSDAYGELLKRMQEGDALSPSFTSWREVVSFMHKGSDNASVKDSILSSIFKAHRRNLDSRWRTVLLVIFWPALESIHWQKRRWDSDPDERWQNIVWTFLKVISNIDPEIRQRHFASKVFNDTVHHLCDEYRRSWKRAEWEISMDDETIDDLAAENDVIDETPIEIAVAQKLYLDKLQKHLSDGTIQEADYLLLVGTRIYGKILADYARENGIGYQAAKKRRQRAEAQIRKADGKQKGGGLFGPQEPCHRAF